ncbi:hypothetical protein LINPERHAP1_LOCUS14928, partial [Linum perenne]
VGKVVGKSHRRKVDGNVIGKVTEKSPKKSPAMAAGDRRRPKMATDDGGRQHWTATVCCQRSNLITPIGAATRAVSSWEGCGEQRRGPGAATVGETQHRSGAAARGMRR